VVLYKWKVSGSRRTVVVECEGFCRTRESFVYLLCIVQRRFIADDLALELCIANEKSRFPFSHKHHVEIRMDMVVRKMGNGNCYREWQGMEF